MSFRNITPFSDGTPTFLASSVSVTYPRPAIQMPACIFELASFPQACFDFAYLFLILEKQARGLAVARNLSGEGQVTNMFECGLEPVKVVRAELEAPKVVWGVLWALSLIMGRDCVQGSSIL